MGINGGWMDGTEISDLDSAKLLDWRQLHSGWLQAPYLSEDVCTLCGVYSVLLACESYTFVWVNTLRVYVKHVRFCLNTITLHCISPHPKCRILGFERHLLSSPHLSPLDLISFSLSHCWSDTKTLPHHLDE